MVESKNNLKVEEVLEVKNFISIKHAKILLKPVTVLIGENATGKSLISKLVYLIREGFLKESFRRTVQSLLDETINFSELKTFWRNEFRKVFEDTFPLRYMAQKELKITYKLGEFQILSITSSGKGIKINFGRNFFERIYRYVEKGIENARKNLKAETILSEKPISLTAFVISETIYAKILNKLIKNIFVPHARTMYLYITMLDVEKRYERFDEPTKSFLNIVEGLASFITKRMSFIDKYILEKYLKYESKVMKGNVVIKKNDIFVKMQDKVFDLYHLSSGQQELTPLMLLLRYGLILNQSKGLLRLCVEEPETCLYPETQKDLTYLLGFLYNLGAEFLITTHSPYILSAFNNLLLAKKLYKEKKNEKIKEKYGDIWINAEDFSAYEIKEGSINSLMNEEGLIEAEAIDKVSDKIANEIDEMLELTYGEDE